MGEPQEDIGSWGTVLLFVSVCNTLVNACITGFVGLQLQGWVGLPDDATFTDRIYSAKLWMIVVMIEHSVLMCKVVAKAFVPDEPLELTDQRNVLEFRKGRDLMPDAQKREIEGRDDDFDNTHNKANDIADVFRAFGAVDVDHSGDLDRSEFRQLLKHSKYLGPEGINMTEEHIAEMMTHLDFDENGHVDFEEVQRWYIATKRNDRWKRTRATVHLQQAAKHAADGNHEFAQHHMKGASLHTRDGFAFHSTDNGSNVSAKLDVEENGDNNDFSNGNSNGNGVAKLNDGKNIDNSTIEEV